MRGCRILEADEVKSILEYLKIRDRTLILTGLFFGMRISEILELTFGHIKGTYIAIKSKKGSDNQAFDIPAEYREAVDELKKHYEDQGVTITDKTPLFLSRKGKNNSITRQQASQIIRAVCEDLGIEGKVNTHSFRKTFVTKIYELTNFNIAETKTYSRHKSLANLDYYIATTGKTNLINNLSW